MKQEPNFFVHESSVVDDGALVGQGSKVWHFSHVSAGARIGQSVILGQNCFVGSGAIIGDRCKIQNNVSVYSGVVLAEDVFCGPSVVFTNVINPRAFIERKDEFRVTNVGKGTTIGANATIICGVDIGEYALIGAGSVVSRNVPEFALVLGVPSRQVGWVDKKGHRLNLPLTGNASVDQGDSGGCYKLVGDQLTHSSHKAD